MFLLACAEAGQQAGDDDTSGPDAALPPDAAPVADASPGTPDAAPLPDAGCTDQVIQLLGNPGFDSGPGGGWVEQSSYPLINADADIPVTPESGGYAVWMGGALSSTDVLYQDVAVPAGATSMQLAGSRWIATEEIGGVYDTVTVQLASTANVAHETLATWSNSDDTTAWTGFTLPASGSYGGQTIRVFLRSVTDSINNTNFFFDTFALRVTVCQ